MKTTRLLPTLRPLLAGAFLTLTLSTAPAALVYYGNQAAFEAAAPTLAVQTFAGSSVAPGASVSLASPLTATAITGPILPGLSLATNLNQTFEFVLAGVGFVGNSQNTLFTGESNRDLIVGITPGATAVGLGLLSVFGGGDVTLAFYSASNDLLGSTGLNGVGSGSGRFFGVIADAGESLSRIVIAGSGFEGLSFVEFAGVAAMPAGGAIPEPTTALFGAALLGVVGLHRRRKQA